MTFMPSVKIELGNIVLDGDLTLPEHSKAIVLFAHGSGSSRRSTRNRYVAKRLNDEGFATLLFDLLTPKEEAVDQYTAELRFDIGLLATRLAATTEWLLSRQPEFRQRVGYFGASTGGGAAIVAAAEQPDNIYAVVSRGGRPDLAGDSLERVRVPVLLIVGGNDPEVIQLNLEAKAQINAPCELTIVPGATHLFEEPGTLEHVATLAGRWFADQLPLENRGEQRGARKADAGQERRE